MNIVAEKEESIKDYKYDIVIFNSNYKKVLKKLIELTGEDIKILEESLINIINMDIVESISLCDIIKIEDRRQ